MRVRRLALLLATFAAAGFVGLLPASSGAAEDGVACGSVITEDTVLTHDLVGCESGLTVTAPDVTLDLGGHRISGRGAGDGVRVQAPGAVVRNGAITGFGVGVFLDASGATVSHLVVASNGRGIWTFEVGDVRIEGNTIRDNTADDFWGSGMYLYFTPNSWVVDNRILNNAGHGVVTIRADGLDFVGNLAIGNGGDGAQLNETISLVTGNTFLRNGGDGLEFDDLCGFLNFSRLGSNVADDNQDLGINAYHKPSSCPAPFDLLDAGGNAASRNGDPRECTVPIECARNRGQAKKLAPLDPTAIPLRPDYS